MVLRIFTMVATSGFLTALECSKCVFGRGSASDPTGGLQRSPERVKNSSWFKGPYFYGGGRGERERRK